MYCYAGRELEGSYTHTTGIRSSRAGVPAYAVHQPWQLLYPLCGYKSCRVLYCYAGRELEGSYSVVHYIELQGWCTVMQVGSCRALIPAQHYKNPPGLVYLHMQVGSWRVLIVLCSYWPAGLVYCYAGQGSWRVHYSVVWVLTCRVSVQLCR